MLGLLDESLETGREEVDVLKLAYELIDEKRYMIEAANSSEAQKASPISRLLQRYYKKKSDETSK